MAPLINCQDIGKSYGSRDLFEGISVTLFAGDRVGLIGPNGAGKSTFLKILSGDELPNRGEIVCSKGLRIGYVPQHVENFSGNVEEVVLSVANTMTGLEEHERYTRVRKILGTLGFTDIAADADTLSGGWKRRLTIAKILVLEPDVVLLDEPTNHLDLDSILWLEGFLKQSPITFVITSHDRVFLDAVCTKIWEISHAYPGGLFAVDGAYAEFMERRAAFLEAQHRYERGIRSKLRREEEWLRQTPKARTTKSRSRIQEAAKLQQELACVQRRNVEKKADVSMEHSGRLTRKLITAKNISKAFGDDVLFSGIDVTVFRGDRLGIVGNNGSGKSTLMKILAKDLSSDTGTVKHAEGLEIFFFDQHREQLDLSLPLRRGLSPSGDTIYYRGKSVHVDGWAERFLFTKDRLDMPMAQLSGGERARVVIARLMAKPADILFLDEPTNDLDIDTLEILEEGLDDFPGAVVLVTHDRAMMDRVADRLIAVGCDDSDTLFDDTTAWLDWRKEQERKRSLENKKTAEPRRKKKTASLSYKEQQELATIEQRIVNLENSITALTLKTEDSSIACNSIELQKTCDLLAAAQKELDTAFIRWQELEDRRT